MTNINIIIQIGVTWPDCVMCGPDNVNVLTCVGCFLRVLASGGRPLPATVFQPSRLHCLMSCKDSVQSEIIIVHKPLPLACFSSSLPFTTESFSVNVMPYFTLLSDKLEGYFHFSYVHPFLIIQQFLLLPSSCYCCCYVASVVSVSVWPHRWQPTGLPHPWDSPG